LFRTEEEAKEWYWKAHLFDVYSLLMEVNERMAVLLCCL